MTSFLSAEILWSLAVIIVVPVVIVGAAEVEERLRQADSPFGAPVHTLRNWVLPFFAAWALLVPVLAVNPDAWYQRVIATGLLLALGVTGWQLLGIVGRGLRSRPAEPGRRVVPGLVLVFPRLALVIGIGAFILAGVWGVDLSAALTALGVTSLVVSFALQDTLSGLASGVLLLSDRPFKPGDWISAGQAGEVEGQVVDLNWRTSRIRDRNGDLVVVPNSQLANASLVNHSEQPLHRVVVSLQVAFVNPPTLAKDMLLDAARAVPGVLTDPPPAVLVTTIDDPLMGYDVHLWVTDFAIVPRVTGDFGALVWYQSKRHNVPLPSPAQDIFVHDPLAEAQAAEPTLAALRGDVTMSPLLAQLPDEDLDRLAASSRRARYRADELIVDSAGQDSDVIVVTAGVARLMLLRPGRDEAVISDLGAGDLVGLLNARRAGDWVVAARAVTDCEVLVIDGDAIGQVGSRNADVVAAFNRVATSRQRRIDRLITSDRPALDVSGRPGSGA
jgi:small-conductance mechanosensitive channel